MRDDRDERLRKAQSIVYRLLKYRLYSEHEIREKLKSRKLPAPIIKRTIQTFKELALIDDGQFARQWIASRLKKPFGPNRIRQELKTKGIDQDIIDRALKEATLEYDEPAVALGCARRRAALSRTDDPEKTKQRVYAYLCRRGFSMNSIMQAIKTL